MNPNQQAALQDSQHQEHRLNALSEQIGRQQPFVEEGNVKPSKKQMKKQLRKQKWEKERLIRKALKKERAQARRAISGEELINQNEGEQKSDKYLRENLRDGGQQRGIAAEHKLMRKRREDYAQRMSVGAIVVIDLQFYDQMHQKEQVSLVKQLAYCHSVNRNSQRCFNYVLSSATAERQAQLTKQYNADKWGIRMIENHLLQEFHPERIIYLSGDAEEEIVDFEEGMVYVIGGIVDHNRLKGITYNFAVEHKLATRRLPMHGVKLRASVHLAVNHVWEWMLKKYNGSTWQEAIKAVIPMRKRIE